MLNTNQILDRYLLSRESVTMAVQQVRTLVESAKDPLAKAAEIASCFLDAPLQNTDPVASRMIAQYLVQEAVKRGESYNPTGMATAAEAFVAKMKIKWPHAWTSDVAPSSYAPVTTSHQQEGVTLEVKADGTIKKGSGRRLLALALYKKHLGKPTKELLPIFIKELSMGEAGARTYMYNAKKDYEKEIAK